MKKPLMGSATSTFSARRAISVAKAIEQSRPRAVLHVGIAGALALSVSAVTSLAVILPGAIIRAGAGDVEVLRPVAGVHESAAEGVETGEQATILKESQCELLQGYLFSRPVGPDEFVGLFKPQA